MLAVRTNLLALTRTVRAKDRLFSWASARYIYSTPNSHNTSDGRPRPSKEYKEAKPDVWTMFNRATLESKAINLGQGFMDFDPPDFVKDAAVKCVSDGACLQYSPKRGRPSLLNEIKNRYSQRLEREIDEDSEIMVTTGANQGILCAIGAFLNKDEQNEAIVIEPAFDIYIPMVEMFGGKVKYVPLRMDSKLDPKNNITSSRDWKLDIDELESKMSPKSRLLIINTPQNPTGKVFSMEELGRIAEVAKKHNLIVISDEVYEYLCYDKEKHVSIAKIPGMWERTIVVGSLGKLFGVTGWRIGWLIGDQSLISACLNFHTYTLFCSPSPLQEAGAIAFREAGSHDYYALTREQYLHRRNKLMSAFDAINMPYSIPQGAYYLLVNAEKLKIPEDYPFPDYILKRSKKKGFKLAYFFTKEIGITAIPAQEFYCEAHGEIAENYLRFSFCKTDKVLDMVSQRLKRTIQYM